MRICGKCKIEKEDTEFYRKKRKTVLGFSSRCKACIQIDATIQRNLPENKIKVLAYRNDPERKAAKSEYDRSEVRRAYNRNYRRSEAGQLAYKKWYEDFYNDPENRLRVLSRNRSPKIKLVKRKSKLKINFKIDQALYEQVLAKQNGVCWICKTDDPGRANTNIKYFCVDHDHSKPLAIAFRGLLCNHCNTGLGFFRDNIDALKNAIKYLETYNKLQNQKIDPKMTFIPESYEIVGNFSTSNFDQY
jgi:hypothetical protein